MSMKPLIRRGGLSDRYYAITRYKTKPDGTIEAIEKYDISDDMAPFLDEARQQGRDLARLEAEGRIRRILKDTEWLTRLQRKLGIVR